MGEYTRKEPAKKNRNEDQPSDLHNIGKAIADKAAEYYKKLADKSYEVGEKAGKYVGASLFPPPTEEEIKKAKEDKKLTSVEGSRGMQAGEEGKSSWGEY